MERKIGEIFEHNNEWYQCIPDTTDDSCNNCYFQKNCSNIIGDCSSTARSDGKSVAFKKLEKVGEPYMLEDKKFQKYKVVKTPYIYHKVDCSWQSFSDPYYVSLEIKEDMEKKKLNLKPFDLEAAKAGKPVCTRDGRKARIICFDAKGEQPIIALFEKERADEEIIQTYSVDGSYYTFKKDHRDLMMLSEKKEGWINIYTNNIIKNSRYCGSNIYASKEDALNNISKALGRYISTIKIEWED